MDFGTKEGSTRLDKVNCKAIMFEALLLGTAITNSPIATNVTSLIRASFWVGWMRLGILDVFFFGLLFFGLTLVPLRRIDNMRPTLVLDLHVPPIGFPSEMLRIRFYYYVCIFPLTYGRILYSYSLPLTSLF